MKTIHIIINNYCIMNNISTTLKTDYHHLMSASAKTHLSCLVLQCTLLYYFALMPGGFTHQGESTDTQAWVIFVFVDSTGAGEKREKYQNESSKFPSQESTPVSGSSARY